MLQSLAEKDPVPFCNLAKEYSNLRTEIESNLLKVLSHGRFIGGDEIHLLEQKAQEYCNVPYAIACSSGTDALLLLLMALGIQKGDVVITTPFTFIATAETIALVGAKPLFVDIDETSYNISPQKLKEALRLAAAKNHPKIEEGEKVKAIIAVDLYGQPADYEEIQQAIKEYESSTGKKIALIEDAAQAFGAQYKGKRAGSLAPYAATSFFPAKPLGTYGDAGMVFTTDEQVAKQVRQLLNHGQSKRYVHSKIGLNARMDTMQAAILLAKFEPYCETYLKNRKQIANEYKKQLERISDFVLPEIKEGNDSAWAQFTIRARNVKQRNHITEELQKRGIPTAIHYPKPLHLQECFAYLGYQKGDLPVAEKVADHVFSLPMDSVKTQEEIAYIAQNLIEIVKTKSI
ncbi:MAG: DegT/DnrJ/EryC1/StrS family aminotransferase [Candidatus Hydrogenedentota bacterium]|nr:MAG: DegT/DnrJ/EryC1/StrS family aminotransferase [Candidatus Hydrogenedentota bacterium]